MFRHVTDSFGAPAARRHTSVVGSMRSFVVIKQMAKATFPYLYAFGQLNLVSRQLTLVLLSARENWALRGTSASNDAATGASAAGAFPSAAQAAEAAVAWASRLTAGKRPFARCQPTTLFAPPFVYTPS